MKLNTRNDVCQSLCAFFCYTDDLCFVFRSNMVLAAQKYIHLSYTIANKHSLGAGFERSTNSPNGRYYKVIFLELFCNFSIIIFVKT